MLLASFLQVDLEHEYLFPDSPLQSLDVHMLAENDVYVGSRVRAIAEMIDDALNQVFLIVGDCGGVLGREACLGCQ